MRTLTISFENQDQLVVPADAIEYFEVGNVTTSYRYSNGHLQTMPNADSITLNLYVDAIKKLKTKDMKHYADEKDKDIIGRLRYPDMLDIQIDNQPSIYIPWEIADDLTNPWQSSEIYTSDTDDKEILQITIERITYR